MRLRAAAIGLALAGAACAAALAQTPDAGLPPDTLPYPANTSAQDEVQAWVSLYLPMQGYVVGAWSTRVVMLVATGGLDASRYPLVTTKVLSEVLTPDAAKAAGWRAAEQVETFDCTHGVYQVMSSLFYRRGDRQDQPQLEAGDAAWTAPDDGATMDTVQRAACFYGERQHAAQRSVVTPPAPAQAKPAAKRRAAKHPRAKPKIAKAALRHAVR